MKKNKKNIRVVTIECNDPKKAKLIKEALEFLDELGWTVCKKDSLVLDNEMK